MNIAMRLLGSVTSLYMFLCFLRIMLTWIDGASLGRPYELLASATDPYLNWFRRFPRLRSPSFDFSPLAALALLALANNIFLTIGYFGKITLGIILSMLVSGAWSAVSFVLVFFTVIIIVRLISLVIGRESILPIWRLLDDISRPVLYKINRFFYKDHLVSYQRGMGTAIATLLGSLFAGGIIVRIFSGLLAKLPF